MSGEPLGVVLECCMISRAIERSGSFRTCKPFGVVLELGSVGISILWGREPLGIVLHLRSFVAASIIGSLSTSEPRRTVFKLGSLPRGSGDCFGVVRTCEPVGIVLELGRRVDRSFRLNLPGMLLRGC